MDKKTAAELLGVSEKTVSRYVASGRLSGQYIRGKTGQQLDFDAADVERLKAELAAPTATIPKTGQPEAGQDSTALARLVPHGTQTDLTPFGGSFSAELDKAAAARYAAVLDAIEAHRKPYAPLADKFLLTVAECAALTGLSRAMLRAAIADDDLQASRIGRSLYVKRSELERFVESL
jgi:excisionase family DNA binding protein